MILIEILDAVASASGAENIPTQYPPSLDIIVCTIEKLLSPEPLYAQICDFLRLLCMVEFWRLRAMSPISNALVYQEYYKGPMDQDYILLPQPVEDSFRDHERSCTGWRTVFMKILSRCTEVVILRSI